MVVYWYANIPVITFAGSDTRRSTSALPDNSRTSSHSLDVGFSTVPRSTPTTATPAHASAMDSSKDYMPGMEKKKKKSILSFFQRKKGGKFNVVGFLWCSVLFILFFFHLSNTLVLEKN